MDGLAGWRLVGWLTDSVSGVYENGWQRSGQLVGCDDYVTARFELNDLMALHEWMTPWLTYMAVNWLDE